MNNLSNEPSSPKELSHDDTGQASPGTALMTMFLLIAGLLLASTMMIHHSTSERCTEGDATFNLLATLKKAKTYTAQLKKTTKETQANMARWPKLTLTGFGISAEGEGGFAILNGEKVHLGQCLDGKTKLVQIRPHDVVVEYRGETKFLTVNTGN